MNIQELKNKHGIQVLDLEADINTVDMFLFTRDTRDGATLNLVSDNLKNADFEQEVYLDLPSIDELQEILTDCEVENIYCDDFEMWFQHNF